MHTCMAGKQVYFPWHRAIGERGQRVIGVSVKSTGDGAVCVRRHTSSTYCILRGGGESVSVVSRLVFGSLCSRGARVSSVDVRHFDRGRGRSAIGAPFGGHMYSGRHSVVPSGAKPLCGNSSHEAWRTTTENTAMSTDTRCG
jgi:hypothetical protein